MQIFLFQIILLKKSISIAQDWLQMALYSSNIIVYGIPDSNVLPFKFFSDVSSNSCESNRTSFHDLISCLRPTFLISWTQKTALGLIIRYTEDPIDNKFEVKTQDNHIFCFIIFNNFIYG
jgi:hypothetical protein